MGSVVLLGSTALGFATMRGGMEAQAAENTGQQPGAALVKAGHEQARGEGLTGVANVQGTFSYDQNAVTPSATIANVFMKAVSSLCTSMPNYGVAMLGQSITVRGYGTSFEATVPELQESEGAVANLMACSCSSNLAGGGAVANAKVSGVSFESLARMAGALD